MATLSDDTPPHRIGTIPVDGIPVQVNLRSFSRHEEWRTTVVRVEEVQVSSSYPMRLLVGDCRILFVVQVLVRGQQMVHAFCDLAPPLLTSTKTASEDEGRWRRRTKGTNSVCRRPAGQQRPGPILHTLFSLRRPGWISVPGDLVTQRSLRPTKGPKADEIKELLRA